MPGGHLLMALALTAVFAQSPGDHAHHGEPLVTTEGGWVKYRHKTVGFSLEHPPGWHVVASGGVSTHIAHPTKPAHLFASVFTMPEGTLEEFAELKFGVQPEIFKAIGPTRPMTGVGWTGVVQEAETVQDGQHALRRILCAKHEGLYVSLALYVDPQELAEHEKDYERLFTSLRFGE